MDPLLSPSLFSNLPPPSCRAALHSGSTWTGVQRSGRNSYKVKVTLDYVSIKDGVVNGLLEIHGLTPQLESLTTFFEGDIIGDSGPNSGFLTGRWGATEKDDLKHWQRFAPFREVKNGLEKPNLNYCNIHGASYAGFYYLCLEFNPSISTSTSPTLSDSTPFHPPRQLSSPRPLRANHSLPSRDPPTGRSPNQSPARSTRHSRDAISHHREETSATSGLPTTSPLPLPVPISPQLLRRTSSNFSYADAAAGRSLSPTGLGLGLTLSTSNTPPQSPRGGFTTPKELDASETEFHSLSSILAPSSSPITTSTSLPTISPLLFSPSGTEIPLPLGTTRDDFPVPSSPPSLSGQRRLRVRGHFSGGAHMRGTGESEEEEDERVAAGEIRRGRSGGAASEGRQARRSSQMGNRNGKPSKEGEAGKETQLAGPYSQATMTGFYFFRNSEPYALFSPRNPPGAKGRDSSLADYSSRRFQELELKYVPRHRGGSQAFGFR
ncbi:glucose-induced degradation protein 4, partial [Phenoliferia sp. Uapishka_3]